MHQPVRRHPPPKPPANNYLLPQIICCERRTIPRFCAVLDLFGLQDCTPDLTLVTLAPSSEPPTHAQTGPADGCGRIPVRVSIPVAVHLRSHCGNLCCASSVVDVETWLPCSFAPDWQQRVFIQPRLFSGCGHVCGGRLEVPLQVELDFYLLCFKPSCPAHPGPACPNLPLYPPPIHR